MSEENYDLPENWRAGLPEDMQSSGVLETVKSIETLAKMAIDGRNLANTALRIPSEDATADDRTAFRSDLMSKMPDLMFKPTEDNPESFKEAMKAMGMPTEITGYDMPDIPEAIKDNMSKLVGRAHEAGLTKAQLSAITAGILDDYKISADESTNYQQEEQSKLKAEWGTAYDSKVETIKHFAKQTGYSDAFIEAIGNGQVDAINMKAFDHVVKGFEGEALEIGRQVNDPSAVMPPGEADARINEIMGNKDHAYWNQSDPAHKAAIDKVLELGKLAEAGRVPTAVDKLRASLAG